MNLEKPTYADCVRQPGLGQQIKQVPIYAKTSYMDCTVRGFVHDYLLLVVHVLSKETHTCVKINNRHLRPLATAIIICSILGNVLLDMMSFCLISTCNQFVLRNSWILICAYVLKETVDNLTFQCIYVFGILLCFQDL